MHTFDNNAYINVFLLKLYVVVVVVLLPLKLNLPVCSHGITSLSNDFIPMCSITLFETRSDAVLKSSLLRVHNVISESIRIFKVDENLSAK